MNLYQSLKDNKFTVLTFTLLTIAIFTIVTLFSLEIRELNNELRTLDSELTAERVTVAELEYDLSASNDELTLTQGDLETTASEKERVEEEKVQAQSEAQSANAESKRQKGIAWNAQTERDQIAQEKAVLAASWEQLLNVTANYSLASDHYEEVVRYVDLALDYIRDDNYSWANYMIDLAAEENASALYYVSQAQALINSM